MTRPQTLIPMLVLLAVAGWATACGDGATEPPAPDPPTPDPPRPTTLTVTPATAELTALGETVRLAADVRDQNGQAMAGAAVTWSSGDPSAATVDPTGLVTAAGNGTATITATSGPASGSAAVTVAQAVSAVAVSPAVDTLVARGDTARLTAAATDGNGHAVAGAEFSWASGDTAVATVDAAGLVTGVAAGEVEIAATASEVSGTAVVTVMQSVGSVVVSPAADTVAPGDTLRLAAEAFDENGRWVEGTEFTWSSSNVAVARVDGSGLVTGVAEGTATITATTGEASGTSDITVENPDRAALVAFYEATDGTNWVNNENWLTDSPLGTWYGVRTDGTGRVVWLNLGNNALTGTVPPQLGQLTSLRGIQLGVNSLTGRIPSELGNLANLERLSLTRNRFSGTIPVELGNLAKLESLALNWNHSLTGPVPRELSGLPNLRLLWLQKNRLTGSIPRSFLRSSLENLRFHENDGLCISGNSDFAAWAATLDRFEGPYCDESDRASLERLYRGAGGSSWLNSSNWLTDTSLDDWYGVGVDTLGRVKTLDLSRNQLSGSFPSAVADLAELADLRIGGNALSGRLPLSMARLGLEVFHYSDTDLCTPTDAAFSQWLSGISSHEGTGVQCAPLSDRDRLIALYEATGGPSWTSSTGWLSDLPLGSWHGVEVDGDGGVVRLVLPDNALTGRIPVELAGLGRLTDLLLSGNNLTGVIPPGLANLASLRRLDLDDNDLTGPIPPELGKLANLELLRLAFNELEGPIPPELGNLRSLRRMALSWNQLTGVIPSELANLTELEDLALYRNNLSGPVPPELGGLANLRELVLSLNNLSGSIPPELGELSSLRSLSLAYNDLAGPISSQLGNLTNLSYLHLGANDLTGPIPPQLGNLTPLRGLYLNDNKLTGPIPPEIGNLADLVQLDLANNSLTGPVPPEFGDLTVLRRLTLAWNTGLSGALPASLTKLRHLETLQAGGTALCATNGDFLEWLRGVPDAWVPVCEVAAAEAYMVQSVQSPRFPVPLVAGREALLRVFVTAAVTNEVDLPPVRVFLYRQGELVHSAEIPGKRGPIPTEMDERSLARSSNALIPPEVIRPGLEMVLEIDPEGTLDAGLGVATRIPASGRLGLDVRTLPVFDLTVVPVVRAASPDSSILAVARQLTAQSDLLRETRTLLPIGDLLVTIHEPVTTTTSSSGLLSEIEAIRVMEGAGGHYLGLYSQDVSLGGIALRGGKSSLSLNRGGTIAHELGHNLSLGHAPCGSAGGVDPFYPHSNGTTGAWGYDRASGDPVSPNRHDLMSYCSPDWISDYSFTKALRFRLRDEPASGTTAGGHMSQSLLLWGGTDVDGQPYLEPAFVVNAPPALPDSAGDYRVIGQNASGGELFEFSFTMPVVGDGDGSSGFAFVLPARPEWESDLARITLTGPGGSFTLDGDAHPPMAILRNPQTGQVRSILRDLPPPNQTAMGVVGQIARPRMEVLLSRGIPGAEAWRR